MHEIRFHGRGGQGTVVASILLAKAFFNAGYFVQTFPLFGVERRGAPVEAYLRLDKEKILVRSGVYAPDDVVVQDPKLIYTSDVTKGLKSGGWILINCQEAPKDLKPFSGYRLAFVDATHIAVKNELGTLTQPMINTAMIGAFAQIWGMPPMKAISAAITEDISVKPENNVKAAKEAYERVKRLGLIDV